MRTASSTTPRPTTYDELAEQYKSANYRFKEKRQLVTGSEVRSFLKKHYIIFDILRRLI